MKKNINKYILFLVLISLCGMEIQCQVEAGAIGTKWTFGKHKYSDDSYDYSGTIPDEICYDFSFTIEKDTLINNNTLKKVIDDGGNFELLSFTNDKISFYKRDSLFTYMDANRQIGDTVIISKNYTPNFFNTRHFLDTINSWGYIINDIDSIELNGSKYLRQKIQSLDGQIGNHIYNYIYFGELIYPFGSTYNSIPQIYSFNMSMLGVAESNGYINSYHYDYSKSIDSNGEIIELYTDHNDCPNTSIDLIAANEINISIFPNPTSDELFISDHFNQIDKVTVFDLYSKEIKKSHPYNNLINIEMSEFANGIYLLHLKLKNGKTVIEKIYKER